MTMKKALQIAKKTIGDRCLFKAHYGNNKRQDRGVQLYGCMARDARVIGYDLAQVIPNSTLRVDAGFVCVWL
jgi:hypothetical protein